MIPERHLFGPGPSNPYPEATAALARRCSGTSTRRSSRSWTRRARCSAPSGVRRTPAPSRSRRPGSAGMEAAFVNTVHDGDVVVVAVNGLFGQRMCDVAARCGAEVVAVEHEWGQPVDVDRVLAAHPQPGDHRRGARRDLHRRALRHRRARRRARATPCWSPTPSPSIAGIELARRRLGHRRRLRRHPEVPRASPPGWRRSRSTSGPSTGASRSRAVVVPRPQPPRRLRRRGRGQAGAAARTYHHTAPVAMVVSLHAALARILDEGLPKRSGPGTPTPVARLQEGLRGARPRALRRRGLASAGADHRQGARRRRLGRRPPLPARRARPRDRRRRRRVRVARCGGSG